MMPRMSKRIRRLFSKKNQSYLAIGKNIKASADTVASVGITRVNATTTLSLIVNNTILIGTTPTRGSTRDPITAGCKKRLSREEFLLKVKTQYEAYCLEQEGIGKYNKE